MSARILTRYVNFFEKTDTQSILTDPGFFLWNADHDPAAHRVKDI